MSRQIMDWLDPVLSIGLFISMSIGAAMVLTGNTTQASLTIALLGTVITLLVNAIARIQRAERLFLEAIELSGLLSDGTVGSTLRDVMNSCRSIRMYNFAHYCCQRLKSGSPPILMIPGRMEFSLVSKRVPNARC